MLSHTPTPEQSFSSQLPGDSLTTSNIRQLNEREIKFQVPPRFSIPEELGSPLPSRVFTSTYFDSESHRLGQFGLTLRKRVEGGRSLWQLKIPSGDFRIELEIESGSRHIPWAFLDLLKAFFRRQEPVILGKLRTWRTGIGILDRGQVVAEVTLDSVALIQENKIIRRFQELELESKNDNTNKLKSIKKALEKEGACVKPLQPKIFQALDLPYPLSIPVPNSETPATDHIQLRLQAQFSQMILHDPGTRLGRDSEALHQMRVATRRIRAILRTVRRYLEPEWTERVRQEVGWIGSLLGEVRDWDVLLEFFRREFSDFSSQEQPAFESILGNFEEQRSIARARLVEGLQSQRYLGLLNVLEDSLTHLPFQPNPSSLDSLARKAFRKVETFVDSSHSRFPPQDIHRMRIFLKRVRYTVELAEPFLGKKAKRFLKQAKNIQDLLGQHQDAIVAENRLREFKPKARGTGIAFVCGVIVERLRNRQFEVRQQVPKLWQKLKKIGEKL